VALFFLAVVLDWLAMARWVYVQDGATEIVEHRLIRANGLTGSIVLTPLRVRLFVGLTLLGGIAGVTMMFLTDVPVPNHVR
jgi:hypothetical protein